MNIVKRLFWLSVFLFLVIGVVGFKLTEFSANDGDGVTWSRAVQWVVMFVVTPGSDHSPTNEVSRIFQTAYGILNFLMLTLLLSTVIIPPILWWYDAQSNGMKRVRWYDHIGKQVYLVVGAVDWDKVQSIVESHVASKPKSHLVVVVAEDLDRLPPDLQRMGVSYVRGSLRDPNTYDRAGLHVATGAYFCAMSHKDPETGTVVAYDTADTDKWTGPVTALVKSMKAGLRTVIEQISIENDDICTGADRKVVFDPLTLGAIAKRIEDEFSDTPVNVEINLIDQAQTEEWERQLNTRGIQRSDSTAAPKVRVVLPKTYDDPDTDFSIHVDYGRCNATGDYQLVLGMYLSITSRALFGEDPNALCADDVLANALVINMLEIA